MFSKKKHLDSFNPSSFQSFYFRLVPNEYDPFVKPLILKVNVSFSPWQVFMANVFQFCFIVLPMMFSLSVFNVITDSMLTKTVPSSDTGETIKRFKHLC